MSSSLELESARRFWYRRVDQRIDARASCVALVVRTLPGQRLEGFGSGFFYERAGWPFFITAKHVLDDVRASIQQGQLPFLLVRGRAGLVKLTSIEFFAQEELDLAVAPLWQRPSSSYRHVDFFTESEIAAPAADDQFAFTGFPASRNKTYTGQVPKPEQRILTIQGASGPLGLSPFLTLPFDSKGLHDSALRPASMPLPNGLSGMSGGPVFSVHGPLDQPTLRLCGVGVAWNPDCALKVLRFDVVDAWLGNHLQW
ncbi:hypothetical protein [Mitsuaria sp. GD03876]|uniref:hypothetical protein n=1 Tax=Mitsuaria sp. GD03876 TaxID=2975399 RepID=UPI00244A909E|nr:hypothetical protein [Mitsuaria sp. GD03876]MDH0865870.1 serine protease [Mitsuaria sp. GD03876]